jgi:ATP-dependent RNA helicase DeaD
METDAPQSLPEPTSGFEAFALSPELQSVIKELGYEEPTPIQRETIPHLLAGRDVLGQAATGTGKTAAFALPMVERLQGNTREPFSTRALVLVPTRELCMQVAEAIRTYGQRRRLAVAAVFGGQEIFHQVKLLKGGVDVVVATPGRVLDHVRRKTLKLGGVRFVVLDEADEMLDMGFADDLDLILSELPENRQTALFSATMAPRIATIANTHLDNPIRVTIAPRSMEQGTLPKIRQAAYVVRRELKESALIRLLDVEAPTSALIFCRTRIEVESLTESLGRRGLLVSALHGGMTQEQRDLTLKRFKGGELKILIATDVAARGLHVESLSHVINFDLPVSPEPYVHRIGRTGRAGREGVALSLLDPREMRLLKNIERVTRTKIPIEKLPGAEVLRKKREAVLSELVRAELAPHTLEAMQPLLTTLTAGTTVEAVAAAALLVAMQRLFPPTEGDEVDFAAASPQRRTFGDRDEAPRARGPAHKSADRRSFDAEAPRSRSVGSERKPYGSQADAGAKPRSSAPRRGSTERRPFGSDAPPRRAASEPGSEQLPKARVSAPRREPAERKTFSEPASEPPKARASAVERKPFAAAEAPKNPAERKPFTAALAQSARSDAPARKPFSGSKDTNARESFDRPPTRKPAGGGDVVTLFIGLGTRAGLRPQDVVGAIANEAGISSREIGNIVIGDENSRVQVPHDAAPEIITALRQTTLRGRKFSIDFDRSGAGPRAAAASPAGAEWKKERIVSSATSKPPRIKR